LFAEESWREREMEGSGGKGKAKKVAWRLGLEPIMVSV
jgi:hypothetical protein